MKKLLPLKLTIKVKRNHIAEGDKSNCYACPIALGLREAFRKLHPLKTGEILRVSVGAYLNVCVIPQVITGIPLVITGIRRWCVMVPARAQKFICRFDSGKPVKPFQMTVSIPRTK